LHAGVRGNFLWDGRNALKTEVVTFFFFLNLSVAKMSTLLLIDGHVKILLLLLHLSLCNSNLGGLVLTTLLSFHFWRVRNGFATANEARRKFSVF
jgi:hypothetical protein